MISKQERGRPSPLRPKDLGQEEMKERLEDGSTARRQRKPTRKEKSGREARVRQLRHWDLPLSRMRKQERDVKGFGVGGDGARCVLRRVPWSQMRGDQNKLSESWPMVCTGEEACLSSGDGGRAADKPEMDWTRNTRA